MYLFIFDILRSSYSARTFFYKTSKIFSLKMFLLSFIFRETFLMLATKVTPDVIIL